LGEPLRSEPVFRSVEAEHPPPSQRPTQSGSPHLRWDQEMRWDQEQQGSLLVAVRLVSESDVGWPMILVFPGSPSVSAMVREAPYYTQCMQRTILRHR